MATFLITHEVDDVAHWLSQPTRADVFGPLGVTVRTFTDPAGGNQVGLLAEIPDVAAFQAFMQTPAAADAMKQDGVRAETLRMLAES